MFEKFAKLRVKPGLNDCRPLFANGFSGVLTKSDDIRARFVNPYRTRSNSKVTLFGSDLISFNEEQFLAIHFSSLADVEGVIKAIVFSEEAEKVEYFLEECLEIDPDAYERKIYHKETTLIGDLIMPGKSIVITSDPDECYVMSRLLGSLLVVERTSRGVFCLAQSVLDGYDQENVFIDWNYWRLDY